MMKSKAFSFFTYVSISLLVYISVFAIFIEPPETVEMPGYIMAIIAAAAVFLLVKAGRWKNSSGFEFSSEGFIVVLSILTFSLRLAWVAAVNTEPVSDFYLYQDYAVKASEGVFRDFHATYALFPFKFGYPLILSLVYRIFGSGLMAAKVFNCVISALTALVIYRIGSKAFNEMAGRSAGLVYALWPAQIMYSSVLASEHIFSLLFILSIALFLESERLESRWPGMLTMAAAGIPLALAHFIRPVSSILFPVLAIYLIIGPAEGTWKKSFVIKARKLLLFVAGFLICFSLLAFMVKNLTGVSIWKSSSGFNILVGTNYDSSGMYSNKDAEILDEFELDFKKVHGEAAKRGLERIIGNPAEFLKLVERKFRIMWGGEDYGFYWSTLEFEESTGFNSALKENSTNYRFISQGYYSILLFFAGVGFWFARKNRVLFAVIPMLVFEALAAAHTILEVQSRYHYPAIPFFIIAAGYGIDRMAEVGFTAAPTAGYREESGEAGARKEGA